MLIPSESTLSLATPYLLLLTIALTGALFVPVLRRLFRESHLEEVTPEWLEEFSASRYRPMERLLSSEDFDFLASQPGFEPQIAKKLRNERKVIFRSYFNSLIQDFNRLHITARAVIAHSKTDQSHAAAQLMRLRFAFSLAVLRTEVSFALYRMGVGSMNSRAVVAYLEEMSAQVHSLATAPIAQAA